MTMEKTTDFLTKFRQYVGAYELRILVEGDENDPQHMYKFWVIKNLELTENGGLRFFSLVPVSIELVDEKAFPVKKDDENMLEYMLRLESLPEMEWRLNDFADYINLSMRGRFVYHVSENGEHTYILGDKLGKAPISENKDSNVTPLRPTTL